MEEYTISYTKTIIGIAMFILSIFLLVIFISYYSLYHTDLNSSKPINLPIRNAAGITGAYISYPLLQTFGYAIYLLPLIICIIGIRILMYKSLDNLFIRFFTLLLTLLTLSYLLAHITNNLQHYYFLSLGGYVGQFLYDNYSISHWKFLNVIILLFTNIILIMILSYTNLIKISQLIYKILSFVLDKTLIHLTNYGLQKTIIIKNKLNFMFRIFKSNKNSSNYIQTNNLLNQQSFNSDNTLTQKYNEIVEPNIIDSFSDNNDPYVPSDIISSSADVPNFNNYPVADYKTVDNSTSHKKILNSNAISDATLPKKVVYQSPPLNLLQDRSNNANNFATTKEEQQKQATQLISVLEEYSITGKILKIHQGPVVTLFEFQPSAGIKSSRVIGLSDDIARSMQARTVRISVISGKNALGIEIPNQHRIMVSYRELLESKEYKQHQLQLPLLLGKNITGKVILADLASMPHLLMAGTTGAGKSVAINTMILSLLYSLAPEECKILMIDPKILELSIYNGIPHLLAPVITEPKKVVRGLAWVVDEMETRYKRMNQLNVRNIANYNNKIKELQKKKQPIIRQVEVGFDEDNGQPIYEEIEIPKITFPYLVVIVDELADLMLVVGKEIEDYIQRICQKARAAGIHMIIATQRPSVDVITGIIKANLPTRISFFVTSKIDSRTILGEQGAEQLLGQGDMLYMHKGEATARVHGAFVSDTEVETITNYLKQQTKPEYNHNITNKPRENEDDNDSNSNISTSNNNSGNTSGNADDIKQQAINVVLNEKKTSISYLQRRLRIGYNKAANLIEQMQQEGILSQPDHRGKREIINKENNNPNQENQDNSQSEN